MPTPNCNDGDEMLPRVALERSTPFIAELVFVEPYFTWSEEVESDPLEEDADGAGRAGAADGEEMGAAITSNSWWPEPLASYPASSATYVAIICRYCGGSHVPEQCPRVIEIHYYRSGAIRRVKLRPPHEVRATVTVSHPPIQLRRPIESENHEE